MANFFLKYPSGPAIICLSDMQITDSNIVRLPERQHIEKDGKGEGLKAVTGHHHHHKAHEKHLRLEALSDDVSISDEARSRLNSMLERMVKGKGREINIPGGIGHNGFIKSLLAHALAGRDINILNSAPLSNETSAADPQAALPQDGPLPAGSTSVTGEFEAFSFSASGMIRTGDGQEVAFSIEMSISRASVSGSVIGNNTTDNGPLTVNFGGSSAELTSIKFEFEIGSSTENGEAAASRPGSGLLTLEPEGPFNAPNAGLADNAASGVEADEDEEENRPLNNVFALKDMLGGNVLNMFKDARISSFSFEYSRAAFSYSSQNFLGLGNTLTQAGSAPQLDLVA